MPVTTRNTPSAPFPLPRFECVRLEALANRLGHPTLNSRGFKAGSEPTGDYIDPEDLTSTSNDPSPSTPEPASTSTSTGTQQAASATPQHYDVVLASEVIEHVKRPDLFCLTLGQLTAPGGTAIVSTLNRTPEAFGLAVVAAEYITGIVPRCADVCVWQCTCVYVVSMWGRG